MNEPGKGPFKNTAFLIVFGIAFGLGIGVFLQQENIQKNSKVQPSSNRTAPATLPDDFTAGGPYNGRITNLYVYENTLYATGWHMGIYKTSDGKNWAPFDANMPGYKDVLSLADNPVGLFAGTFYGELFRYDNSGRKLLNEFGKGEKGAVYDLDISGNRMVAAAGGRLLFSEDGFKTSQELISGDRYFAAKFSPFHSNIVFFGTYGKGPGKCDIDNGKCEYFSNAVSDVRLVQSIFITKTGPPTVYFIGENAGVFKYEKDSELSKLALPFEQKHTRAFFADDQIMALSIEGEGLYVRNISTDAPWKLIPFSHTITALTRFSGSLFVGTDGLGVFALHGDTLVARNNGLINFPEQVIEDALSAEKSKVND